MYVYLQRSGRLLQNDRLVTTGYAGFGVGKNNPSKQAVPRVGPIPQGAYYMGVAFTHPTLGPIAIPLEPLKGTEMFGRSGFYMHGMNALHPDDSSHGCPVVGKPAREGVASGKDRLLIVLSGD